MILVSPLERHSRIWKGVSIGPGPVCQPTQKTSRLTCEIERTLRRGASTPHTKYDKEKVKDHKLEIQRILTTLTTPNLALDRNLSMDTRAPPDDPPDAAATSISESGTSSAPPSLIAYGLLIADHLFFLDFNTSSLRTSDQARV